ncbi:MAG TPA: DNA polymerase III subunit gamma/tau [Ruminococcaceae bacterium]|nr:DNA polymerase III subunit gamma/tau [Oscillospiraceae bacterium]
MYRALYRKWRPNQFADVVGQQHITQTLRNELTANKTAHAYLFTGSRGTGKTTCAKILAKAVNCEHLIDGNPCNECEVCKGIDSGAILDVVEIDAASNNGVDNIRDLREEANYTPVRAKYRVYIIDEVHMLSIGAFNALLKTLEEPPEYVKFILATTEVYKLPATILSRCQRFDFKRIEPDDIADRLETVAQGEGIALDREAGLLIARVADGALRDALSLLDQCAGQSDTVTPQLVSRVAGLTGREHLFRLAECIRSSDCAGALTIINELHTVSCDMERLCTQLIDHYRNLMIIRAVNHPSGLIVCTSSELKMLEEQANGYTLEGIMHILNVLEDAAASMRKGTNRRIEAELAFVKLCTPNADTSVEALLKRIAELEKAVRTGSVAVAAPAPNTEAPTVSTAAAPAPTAPEPLPDGECALWADILQELKAINMPLFAVLSDSTARVQGNYLVIASPNPSVGAMLKVNNNSADLKKAVFNITGHRCKIGIERPSAEPATQVTNPENDPLDALLKEAKKMGIEIKT